MNLFITGAAGFIGSNFVDYLMKTYPDYKVKVYDALTYAGNIENLDHLRSNPNFEFAHKDIRSMRDVTDNLDEGSTIIHFAAESHVDRSIMGADDFVTTNVNGTFTLLEAAKKKNVKLFIHISTDEVYGSIKDGSFFETSPLNPSSPYSASKASSDLLALSYHITYGMPVIVTRSSNNYGPYQYPEKVIPLFITNAMEDKPLPLYGEGLNVRDWLYVEDNCKAIDAVLHKGKPGNVYNIGAGYEESNIDITYTILDIMKKPESLIKKVPDRLGHDFRYSINFDKLKALGWRPENDFKTGIKKTIEWYINNEKWWKKIKEKNEEYKKFSEKYYVEGLRR